MRQSVARAPSHGFPEERGGRAMRQAPLTLLTAFWRENLLENSRARSVRNGLKALLYGSMERLLRDRHPGRSLCLAKWHESPYSAKNAFPKAVLELSS
jgi:hypothetical protein